MKEFIEIIAIPLVLVVAFFLLVLISEAYKWVRHKYNKPHVGYGYLFSKILKRGDYVSIKGKIMCFNHFAIDGETIDPIAFPSEENKTLGGEIAFRRNGIGYIYYLSSSLKDCEFIYGEYGLKWAVSEYWASVAKERVDIAIKS